MVLRFGSKFRVVAVGLLLMVSTGSGCSSWELTELKLVASDGEPGDQFGWSVATVGDRIVVGARWDDDKGVNAGAVYVFDPDEGEGGYAETKLVASDGRAFDDFGWSVAVIDDRVVVGAPNANSPLAANSGAVYVFDPDGNGGYAETKLVASDPRRDDFFGRSVAAVGKRVVVGAPSAGERISGAVYVFDADGNGGYVETKLEPSDGKPGDAFGWSVAAFGGRLVVGAPRFPGLIPLPDPGAVYAFDPDGDGGYLETKLVPADGRNGDRFGHAVAAARDRVVSIAVEDADGTSLGRMYVFDPGDGTGGYVETKLEPSDAIVDRQFGGSVAAVRRRVMAGAPLGEVDGEATGASYVFDPGGTRYVERPKLVASDGEPGDRFGHSVAAVGGRVVVGAPHHPVDDDIGHGPGAVYLYVPAP